MQTVQLCSYHEVRLTTPTCSSFDFNHTSSDTFVIHATNLRSPSWLFGRFGRSVMHASFRIRVSRCPTALGASIGSVQPVLHCRTCYSSSALFLFLFSHDPSIQCRLSNSARIMKWGQQTTCSSFDLNHQSQQIHS
jgi:hypothetical protein